MTNQQSKTTRGWTGEHEHSRCWWNWEVGRWVCSPTATTRAVATDHRPTEARLEEHR